MISYSHLTAKGAGQGAGDGSSGVIGVVRYLQSSRRSSPTGYYLRGAAPSMWCGTGAAGLGLAGPVDGESLASILAGRLPDGSDISDRGNRQKTRRFGHDLTISAPKSVSILAMAGRDGRLLDAHDAAVQVAAEMAERWMVVARRGKGGVKTERTGCLLAAAYRHEDSRPVDGIVDPQLHTHLVIANATKRADGVWCAASLDFGVRNELLHCLDAVYKAELARRVMGLGYDIRQTKDGFEIAEVTDREIRKFSRRKAEIDKALAAEGLDRGAASAAQRVRANVSTRREKQPATEEEHHAAWYRRGRECGLDLIGLKDNAIRRVRVAGADDEPAAAREAVASAARHLSEREAQFSQAALVREALLAKIGQVTLAKVMATIDESAGELLAAPDDRHGKVFTTREALATERGVLEGIAAGRAGARAIAAPDAVAPLLARHERKQGFAFSAGQKEAVRLALVTGDRHVGIVGAAGSGKTQSMAVIVEAYRHAGYEVVGLAPSGVAARELAKAGCDQTHTLEAELRQRKAEERPRLYVIDEAGMISARDMGRLMRRVAAEGAARTLLVGDPRQLPSVEAGSPFQQMLEEGVLRHVRVDEVQRQRDPALREIAQLFARGEAGRAVAAAQPYMTEVTKADLSKSAAAAYLALTPEQRSETLVMTGTNRMRSEVNAEIRAGLRAEGSLSGIDRVVRALDKADMTREQARRPHAYEAGMVVVFAQDLKNGRHVLAARGSQWEVTGYHERHVTLRPLGDPEAGGEITWRPSAETARAYRARALGLALGERILFREQDRANGIINGMGAVVIGFDEAGGEVVVRTEAGEEKRLDACRAHVIDHGYCRTVHASQGATVERAIVVGEANRVATAETAYVAASRERSGLQIFTDKRARLSAAWSAWAERRTARELLARRAAAAPEALGGAIRRERERQKQLRPAPAPMPPSNRSLAPATAPSPRPTPPPPAGPVPPKEMSAEAPPESQLERAIGEWARAFMMEDGEGNAPKLQAMEAAAKAIQKARPGLVTEDAKQAFRDRSEILAAATTAAGRKKAAAALIAAQAERRAKDHAHEVVRRWTQLERRHEAALQGNSPDKIAKVIAGMEKLEAWLRSRPNVEALLRRRGAEFGIEAGSLLHRAVRGKPWKELLAPEPTPEPDPPEEDSGYRPRMR